MTTAQRSSAYAMIAAKGQTVTLTRRSAGTYDVANSEAAISTATQTGKGVILPLARGLTNRPDSNIPSGAKQCLLGGLQIDGSVITAPKVTDRITDANGVVYDITEVAPLAPAGLAIIYDLTIEAAT